MRTHEVSLSTALQACRRLEDEGWLQARARSGYFVQHPRRNALATAREAPGQQPIDPAAHVGIQAHVSEILARGQQQPVHVNLALAMAPPTLVPAEALGRIMQRKLRLAPTVLTTMARRHGHPLLRVALARRALEWRDARGAAAPAQVMGRQRQRDPLQFAQQILARGCGWGGCWRAAGRPAWRC